MDKQDILSTKAFLLKVIKQIIGHGSKRLYLDLIKEKEGAISLLISSQDALTKEESGYRRLGYLTNDTILKARRLMFMENVSPLLDEYLKSSFKLEILDVCYVRNHIQDNLVISKQKICLITMKSG
jgi:hypothetical protein